jgi:lysozyme family protein
VADAAFNSGARRAMGWLAEVTKLEPVWPIAWVFEDGVLHACAEQGTMDIASAFHLCRVDFLCELVKANDSQLKFLKGWMRRCIRLQRMMGG